MRGHFFGAGGRRRQLLLQERHDVLVQRRPLRGAIGARRTGPRHRPFRHGHLKPQDSQGRSPQGGLQSFAGRVDVLRARVRGGVEEEGHQRDGAGNVRGAQRELLLQLWHPAFVGRPSGRASGRPAFVPAPAAVRLLYHAVQGGQRRRQRDGERVSRVLHGGRRTPRLGPRPGKSSC